MMSFNHFTSFFLDFKINIFFSFLSLIILFSILIINVILGKQISKKNICTDYFLIFYLLSNCNYFFLNLLHDSFVFNIKRNIQIIPFKTIYESLVTENYIQIVGNIFILIPLSILLQARSFNIHKFKQAFLYTFLYSLMVELLQLVLDILFNLGCYSFDVDDLILRTIGGLTGWYLFKLLFPFIKNRFLNFYCIK